MNFLLLRLVLALAVAISHYRLLTAAGDASFGLLSSTVAVQAFFVVSGWIVTASYCNQPQLASFWVRRLMRLYPLYVSVVLLQAALVTLWTPDGARSIDELLRYLGANLAFANFLQPDLYGLLASAPVPVINPSLWTLKIEVAFYVCVPLLVASTRGRYGRLALLAMYVASTAFFIAGSEVSAAVAKQLPGQLRFFVAGMVCQRLAASGALQRFGNWPLALAGCLGLALAPQFDASLAFGAVQPVLVAAFVAAAAVLTPAAFERWPDLSYGVYLIHAPLIQFTHHFGLLPAGAAGLAMVLVATLALAAVAAYAIERPAVRIGRRWAARLSRRSRRANAGAMVQIAGTDA